MLYALCASATASSFVVHWLAPHVIRMTMPRGPSRKPTPWICSSFAMNERFATSVGLPGVIAHGVLTMGVSVQPVVDWAGDPARVSDYQVRFTRPVVVDPEAGATVSVTAKVGQLDAEARVARIDLTTTFNGETVLGKAQVRVSFER